jgi:transposase
MPWTMPNISEQRKQFVIRANSEVECFTTLCRSFGISRTTGYVWLRRYRECMSLTDVIEKTRAPRTTPLKTSAALECRVLDLRDRFGWGAKRLVAKLKMQNIRIASSTVHRIMKGAGRIGVRHMDSTAWMVRVLVADNPIALLEAEFHANEGLSILARFIRMDGLATGRKRWLLLHNGRRCPGGLSLIVCKSLLLR